MRVSRWSIRKLLTHLEIAAAAILLASILITYIATKSLAALLCVFFTAVALAVLFVIMMVVIQKKLAAFTADICETLDAMICGAEQPEHDGEEETLLSRILHQLEKLYLAMKRQKAAVDMERAELQELISDISHQTKTPITNLKMIHDTLLHETPGPEVLRAFLQDSVTQIEKLDFLVEAMVKTSRLETGIIKLKKRTANLYETLAVAVAGVFARAKQKNMEVLVACPEDLPLFHDSRWTGEALFNILDNAVKYTPSGGKIDVLVERWEAYTRIGIRDNGKGISESHQAEIFRRFYREADVHEEEGVGIGLYLAREIVTLQGGYIQVSSEVGKGSVFSVFLPNH